MFYAGQPGVCPAGGGHVEWPNQQMVVHTSPAAHRQEGWRWCKRCGVLVYSGGAGRCAAGGGHDFSSSGQYSVGNAEGAGFFATNFRWCQRCASLHGGYGEDRCPFGGNHTTAGSGEYAIQREIAGEGVAVAYEGRGDSGEIWLTVRQGGQYVPNTRIPGGSSGTPSIVMYQGKLWILYQGMGNSRDLWFTTFDGVEFSGTQQVPDVRLAGSPVATVLGGKLHVYLQGTNRNAPTLWQIVHSPEGWKSTEIGNARLIWNDPAAVTVTVGNTEDVWVAYEPTADLDVVHALPLAVTGSVHHRGAGNLCLIPGRVTANPPRPVPNTGSAGSPSAVFYRGKVWLFHEDGSKSGELWYHLVAPGATADANPTMSQDTRVPNCGISAVVAPVVEGDNLLVFHEGLGDNGELWCITYDGAQNKWLSDTRVSNFGVSTGCAATRFKFV